MLHTVITQLDVVLVAETGSAGDHTAAIPDKALTGENTGYGGGLSAPHMPLSCELALDDCPPHEECVVSPLRSFRSKSGVCQCVEGYSRHPATGACQLAAYMSHLLGMNSNSMHN